MMSMVYSRFIDRFSILYYYRQGALCKKARRKKGMKLEKEKHLNVDDGPSRLILNGM